MLCGSTLQTVKVCGKSTRGRKNIFQRTEWSTSQIRFLVRREDKGECWSILLWDRKMVKWRMDWDLKKWECISWFCCETSHVTSGKALDALAHLTHICEMGIISSTIKKDFMKRTSSMVWVLKQRGTVVSEGVLISFYYGHRWVRLETRQDFKQFWSWTVLVSNKEQMFFIDR